MRGLANVRHTMLMACLMAMVMLTPLLALADDEVVPDARLEGYGIKVTQEGGIGWSVVLLLVLAGITMGVMFISGKRSHLD